jgi:hypothetical protein
MEDSTLKELSLSVERLTLRVEELEKKIGKPAPQKASPPTIPKPQAVKENKSSASLLGFVGIGCLVFALALLIKFSIDSGWLTPMRQLAIATLAGLGLIALPSFLRSDDHSYLSLLPAGGVIVLHMTVYGGVFFHELIPVPWGLGLIWAIGLLSLYLLKSLNQEVYAILSIAGTYLGAFFLKASFESFVGVATNLLLWDVIYAYFSIGLKRRSLTELAAASALLLGGLFSLAASTTTPEVLQQLAVLQLAQVLIFVMSIYRYSTLHQVKLTSSEAWRMMPVFLFFYGHEYHLLDQINSTWAVVFSLSFAATILSLYFLARKNLGNTKLESSPAILSFAALMLYHSVYFVSFNDTARILVGLPLMLLAAYASKQSWRQQVMPVLWMTLLIVIHCLFLILGTNSEIDKHLQLLTAILYGAAILVGTRHTSGDSKNALLTVGHLLMVFSITKLTLFIPEFWVAPLCVAYAFANLQLALKWMDQAMAKASISIIMFAIARFWLYQFDSLSQIERIVALLLMGGLIYAGGLLYRKIQRGQRLS